jgi:hypothetical protein
MEILLTKIPLLNSIVIKQRNGRLFIAAKDSIVIDKAGLLGLVEELVNIGFLSPEDISELSARIGIGHENK